MTQPIAPAGHKALHLSGQADTSVRDKAGSASAPEPVRVKSGADSVSISVAARRQLAISSSVHGDRLQSAVAGASQDGRGSAMSAADKAAAIMNDMRGAFHTREGEDGFNARLDFNRDGMINVQDMAVVRQKLASAMDSVTIVNDPMPDANSHADMLASAPPVSATMSPNQPVMSSVNDPAPVSNSDADMTAHTPPVDATMDSGTSTLDALRASFYTRVGDDGFNSAVDFNKDGVIDARDLGLAKRGSAEQTQPVPPTVTGSGNSESDTAKQTLNDLRASFYTREGEDGYNAAVDFNNDGVVNIRDLAMARAGSAPDESYYTQPIAPQSPESGDAGGRARTLVQQLREAFFSSRGDSHFNASLDANGDGRINVADLAAARDRLGDETS